jgi:hypothetical protein
MTKKRISKLARFGFAFKVSDLALVCFGFRASDFDFGCDSPGWQKNLNEAT